MGAKYPPGVGQRRKEPDLPRVHMWHRWMRGILRDLHERGVIGSPVERGNTATATTRSVTMYSMQVCIGKHPKTGGEELEPMIGSWMGHGQTFHGWSMMLCNVKSAFFLGGGGVLVSRIRRCTIKQSALGWEPRGPWSETRRGEAGMRSCGKTYR